MNELQQAYFKIYLRRFIPLIIKYCATNYNTMAFGTLLCRGSKARIGLNLSSLGPINLNYRKISCDMPQGSVPGPLLFIIFS